MRWSELRAANGGEGRRRPPSEPLCRASLSPSLAGIMDQLACALGREGTLLSLLCRPATLLGTVPIPPHLRVWGIDSAVRHSVGGSDYGAVRTAAFMGRAMLQASLGEGRVLTHLTELTPEELAALPPLPTSLSGSAFLQQHPAGHGDAATTVRPDAEYAVAACAAHPVLEHARVCEFEALLRGPPSEQQRLLLGKLMRGSHESYSRVGLGSAATDRIVELVAAAPPSARLYGAKITGGGSGGTVCVLGEASDEAQAAIDAVLDEYASETGRRPYVVSGSSAGAVAFGHVELRCSP
mmetsp:Transcript_30302/g.95606  ORF Transcript_30302/g.95606 Transcript_30302/m.95606 type:complete len:296 (+) Transcript_30302:683-1570(+)